MYIHFPEGAPREYFLNSQLTIPSIARNPEIGEDPISLRWKEITGRDPKDSRFCLMVPIHNEESSLASMLASLECSVLPSDLDLQIVFVTNACSDSSAEIISEYMRIKNGAVVRVDPLSKACKLEGGELDTFEIFTSSHQYDPNLDTNVSHCRDNNIHYLHLDTRTPGKANAMNIVNKWCIDDVIKGVADEPVDILMSIDANNYPEPEAIAHMYKNALDVNKHNMGAISASYGVSHKKAKLFNTASSKVEGIGRKLENELVGCFLVWNPRKIETLMGGIPRVACEEHALSLLSQLNGLTIQSFDNARIWGYGYDSVVQKLAQYRRVVRGLMKLKAQYPSPQLDSLIEDNFCIMRDFRGRSLELREWIRNNPEDSVFLLSKWLLLEAGRVFGTIDYLRDPESETWKALSTKHG